ncbi:MAG: glycosyltransferase family 4 protein [Chloroflexi bacterium]|nr:glycosyltransferase family 4 protein [Chloroflexota bacterium]MCC6894767.1 glycosyltransferase family 4 protein [Anaerolineae bacterium]
MTNRIGFISTRLAGTDGVSLETAKWANLLTTMDCECYFFAGECDWPTDRCTVVPEAHFTHPAIMTINADLFGDGVRSIETSKAVQQLKDHLKKHLYQFVKQFKIDILIPQNALAIPMNVPLGLAITELIAETGLPTIAHHHDFSWERTRFAVGAAQDYLRAAFPPTFRTIHHVVINSFASHQLALRTGVASISMIPNVMDFDHPPATDDYAADMRRVLGIAPDETFLLQPTRIVPRKRIEQAVDLVGRLGRKAALVITHSAGDEGIAYQRYLRDYADKMGVRLLFADAHFDHHRGTTTGGSKIYSLADAYQQADLITYPSTVEGFGNAFIETIYYKRPIVMSTYEIFKTDIQPKGFQVISYDEFVSDDTIASVRELLDNPQKVTEMVEANYELGRKYYSYQTLTEQLKLLLHSVVGH